MAAFFVLARLAQGFAVVFRPEGQLQQVTPQTGRQ